MEFLRTYQLDFMLVLIGVCGLLAVMAAVTKSLSKKRRRALVAIELGATFLLTFDRLAYIYRGDTSDLGFVMVRVANFMVYFLSLYLVHAFNLYLVDLFKNEGHFKNTPVRLVVSEAIFLVGVFLLIYAQKNGMYYYFDEANRYVRSWGFMISYIAPATITILHITIVMQHLQIFGKRIRASLLIFMIVPYVAMMVQIFAYGLSLTNITLCGTAVLLYIYALLDMNDAIERAKVLEIELLKDEQRKMQKLFEQTAEALANAIDAKDNYTHGHSTRVADYSEKIARLAGKTDKECEEVYFAALLHDVGKIGISDAIINKAGKLTDEEYNTIKQHPVIGRQILSGISQSPYLSIGANYHHERYDGRGYPEGLKGEDIPEIARIIAVADAYDAMTSKRSYRYPVLQLKVREEIVKGIGLQFDPKFAKIMLHLIDLDVDYQMRQKDVTEDFNRKSEIRFIRYGEDYSSGALVDNHISHVTFRSLGDPGLEPEESMPTILLYDSWDGMVHAGDGKEGDTQYFEYGSIRMDGKIKQGEVVKTEIKREEHGIPKEGFVDNERGKDYEVTAVRVEDHLKLVITTRDTTVTTIWALPDSTRFLYMAIGGENCTVSRIDINREKEEKDVGYIPRIAPKVNYIDGPEGDIPNVEVDGWCKNHSKGLLMGDKMQISFHTKSLPTARLVWHCPYVKIYSSDDGTVNGENYKEYMVIRLDGENWESHKDASNEIFISMNEKFTGWEAWKKQNKEGMDCTVNLEKKDNKVSVYTENQGIMINSTTTINGECDKVYVALTGDQVALTNINVKR